MQAFARLEKGILSEIERMVTYTVDHIFEEFGSMQTRTLALFSFP